MTNSARRLESHAVMAVYELIPSCYRRSSLAMDTQTASPLGHHNIIVQAIGDGIHVTVDLPWLKLVSWQARVRTGPQRDIDILNPAYQAVPLIGREGDLQFLHDWLEGSGIAITALVGRGGSGKTRLALELLQHLPDGWDAGFLTPEEATRFVETQRIADWSWQKPTLIVVDYAALLGQVLDQWFTALGDHAPAAHPLRILLLERHADVDAGWYHDLAGSTGTAMQSASFSLQCNRGRSQHLMMLH